MVFHYTPSEQICAHDMEIEIDDTTGRIARVKISGGCPGNHAGISSLVRGMKPEEVIARLEGIVCGNRPTSCPDQLAQALKTLPKA